MRNLSIKILGEFSDSFIYSGVLFLVDFEASISIVNWEALIKHRLLLESGHVRKEYNDIFLYNSDCRKINDFNKADLEIEDISDFLISKIYLSDWPTDINIFSNNLFFSSDRGLKYIEFNGDKRFSKEAYSTKEHTLFDDCKIFGFDMDSCRTILCGGSEGGIYSFLSKGNLELLGVDKNSDWIDCNWYESDNVAYLSLSSKDKSMLQKFKEVNRIRERINTLSYKIRRGCNNTFLHRHLSKIKELREKIDNCVKDDFIKGYKNLPPTEHVTYVKTRRSRFGTFKEMEDRIIVTDNYGNESLLLADDEIVNWRIFPKARTHLNQLHLIDNEFIRILGFENL
ncbi:hypothetical protein [Haemophilus parainfluenzae]|uniref:hypothetical protein n=1 Tax=Haemophilus parainfluenzae TaxID=729 RepID=UPI00223FB5FC|nr:hypothetical protein [Haemophilus parainfluenzae]